MKKLIAPSILSADFTRLGEEIRAIEEAGADWIHFDVMDGIFVPNITVGVPVLKSVRNITDLPLDVHLMVDRPGRFIEDFADAGADIITLHVEASIHLDRELNLIKSLGKRAGVSLNPASPITLLEEAVEIADLILIMSVNPGFGGQKLIPYALTKATRVRELLKSHNRDDVLIEIDGGVTTKNIGDVSRAGVDVFVAGSSVFGADDYAKVIGEMKRAIS
ncbi:MAG: ribulose-phosphate 3-epimerase [Deltaproteobacteria bacterium]|nr:ribulose-phosphate 3-epimerase [Candidatus Zymogenaceae bacterium]